MKFFIWKITHRKEYQERKEAIYNLYAQRLDKQEKFRILLNNFVKKYKKIPSQYALDYIKMSKIKKPWNEDKKVIRKMKKAVRLAIRNEVLNAKK